MDTEKVGDLELTELYWDCDCTCNYIRSKDEVRCPRCGAVRDEHHPDSRVDEVRAQLGVPDRVTMPDGCTYEPIPSSDYCAMCEISPELSDYPCRFLDTCIARKHNMRLRKVEAAQ